MRRVLLAVVLASLCIAVVAPIHAAPQPTEVAPSSPTCLAMPKTSGGLWQCTLDEEFDGTTLNRKLWVPITTAESGFHSGPECLIDSPNNVSVADGVLTLTGRKEAAPF